MIPLVQPHGDDAGLARVAELGKRGFLDRAAGRCHEHVAVGREGARLAREGQHHGDFFAIFQRKHVDDY